MTFLRFFPMAMAIYLAGLIGRVNAASVIWLPEDIAQDGSSVRNGGRPFLAVNFSGPTSAVNGVQFDGEAGTEVVKPGNGVTVTVTAASSSVDLAGTPAVTDPGLLALLDNALLTADVADESSVINITLSGLSTGIYYRVQMFCHDPGGAAGAVDMFARNHTNLNNESAVFAADAGSAKSVTALFVADQETQILKLIPNDNDAGNDRAVLNALSVSESPAPSNRRVSEFPREETQSVSHVVGSNLLVYATKEGDGFYKIYNAAITNRNVAFLDVFANEWMMASNQQRLVFNTLGSLSSISITGGVSTHLNTNPGVPSAWTILPNSATVMFKNSDGWFRAPITGGVLFKVAGPPFLQSVTPDSSRFVWLESADDVIKSIPTTGGSTSVLHNPFGWVNESVDPPIISPDSTKAVFGVNAVGSTTSRLYSANTAGGGEVLLSQPGLFVSIADERISPDSTRVFFNAQSNSITRFYSVPIGGGALSLIETQYVELAVGEALWFAPNSTRIIFVSSAAATSCLYMCSLTGGSKVKLFEDPYVGNAGAVKAAFTPDSSRALFTTRMGSGGATSRLYSVTVPAGTTTLLATVRGTMGPPVISPNGTRAVYMTLTGSTYYALHTIAVTGGPSTRITSPRLTKSISSSSYRWTTDGKRVVYNSDGLSGDESAVYTDVPDPVEPAADVSIRVTTTQAAAVVTYPLDYLITVSNRGPLRTSVVVTNWLPPAVTYQSATASTGTFSHSAGVITYNPAMMYSGEVATLSVTVMSTATGMLTNVVWGFHALNDPATTNHRIAHVMPAVVPQADLIISKTDSKDPMPVGYTLTYRVTVTNLGPQRATNVVVTDVLPGSVSYVSASTTLGTVGQLAGIVTGNVSALEPGQSVRITINTTPNSLGYITNSASVTSATADPASNNNATSEVTRIRGNTPDVIVSKTLPSNPVYYGDLLTYQVVVSNDGPLLASGVVVTDALPAQLEFYTATSTVGTCAFADGRLVCTVGNLASGALARISIKAFAAGIGLFTNSVAIGSGIVDALPENDAAEVATSAGCIECRAGDTFDPVLDLDAWSGISGGGITSSPQMVRGQGLFFSGSGTRQAELRPVAAQVGDVIRYLFRMGDGSAGWNAPESGDGVVLEYSTNGVDYIQVLAPPITVQTWSNITVALPAAAAGPASRLRWRQLANSGAGSDVWALDQVCVGPAQPLVPDLALAGSVTPDSPQTGDPITCAWVVTNRGSAAATNLLAVFNVPPTVLLLDGVASSGSLDLQLSQATLTLPELPPNGSITLSLSAVSLLAGSWTNRGWVVNQRCDVLESDNQTGLVITAVGPALPDLRLTKSILLPTNDSGSTVTYFLNVTNAGFAAAVDAQVLDALPAALTFVSATSTLGSCSFGGTTVTGSLGTVSAGTSAVITIKATAGWPAAITNTAVISSSSQEGTLHNNTGRVAGAIVCVTCFISDDFESGVASPSLWSSAAGGEVVSGAGLAFGNAYKMTNSGSRSLTTVPFDASIAHQLRFSYRAGDGTAGWDSSEVADTVQVQFSATGGAYQLLATYTNSLITQWTNISIGLPVGARSTATTFRIQQMNTSSAGTDPWALDNLCLAALFERAADVGVTGAVPAQTAATGQPLLFSMTVTNSGPDEAQNVMLTASFPPSMLLQSVIAPGGFAWAGSQILATVGSVPAQGTVPVLFSLLPLEAGSWTGSFRVTHASCDGVAGNDSSLISATVTGVTILAGPGYITLDALTVDTPENKPILKFNVARTNGSLAAVAATYMTISGTAVEALDYVAASGQVFFAVGETSKTVLVGIVDDDFLEAEESFLFDILEPLGGASLGGVTSLLVRIQDNDVPGVLTLTETNVTVDEAVGQVVLRVERSVGAAGSVTVDYLTVDSNATAGADYTTASGTLSFGPNEFNASVGVPILDDAAAEGSERFLFRLQNPGGGVVLGTRTQAVVEIMDDDRRVQFRSAVYPVSEGIAGGTVRIEVERSGDASAAATVNYATTPGIAQNGLDFVGESGTVSFDPGETLDFFTVAILDDAVVGEPTEQFTVTLSNPSTSMSLGALKMATVEIRDNDRVVLGESFSSGLPAGWLTKANANPTAIWRFDDPGQRGNRTGGSGGFAIADSWWRGQVAMDTELISPVMNLAGVSQVTLTFASDYYWYYDYLPYGVEKCDVDVCQNGRSGPWINVRRRTGTHEFGPLTVFLDLSATLAGKPKAAIRFRYHGANWDNWWQVDDVRVTSITTSENQPGTLAMALSAIGVAENSGRALVTVVRSGGNAGTVGGTLSAVAETATANTDYTPVGSTFTMGAGVESFTLAVPIKDDTLNEGPETFRVVLSAPTGGATLSFPRTNVVTILDDEGLIGEIGVNLVLPPDPLMMGVQLPLVISASNNGPSVASVVKLQHQLPPSAILVTTSLSKGIATNSAGLFSWNIGNLDPFEEVSATLTARLMQVGYVTNEVHISGDEADAVLENNGVAVTSQVRSAGIVRFGSAAYTMSEQGAALEIDVMRTEDSLGPASVFFSTLNDSAVGGADYATTNGVLQFADGEVGKLFVVEPLDDAQIEGSEFFYVMLSGASGATLGQSLAAVSLLDDDVLSLLDSQDFGGGSGPAPARRPLSGISGGWTVVTNLGTVGWRLDDPGARGNLTGGAGGFAIADSAFAGSVGMDTELRSPTYALTNSSQVVLEFKTDLVRAQALAEILVSTNAHAGPWALAWTAKEQAIPGPGTVVADVTGLAAGQDNVVFSFRYYNATNDGWWAIDDVRLVAEEDEDADGLPDWWEVLNFGNIAAQGATNDYDGDLAPNLHELQADTSPTNDLSSPEMIDLYLTNGMPMLVFEGSPLRLYDIEAQPQPGTGTWESVETSVSGTGGYQQNAVPADRTNAVYRLQIRGF